MVQHGIAELINKGESEHTEFKESFDKESIETAVAFANTRGGAIFIGYDNSGKVKGIKIGKETTNDWANQISQATEPRIIPDIEEKKIEGYSVVIIQIKEFPIKPVSVKGRCFKNLKKVERYIRRANDTGRRKIEESPHEVMEKLGLVKDGKVTWAAILMLGKEPQKPLLQSAIIAAGSEWIRPASSMT